MVTTRSSLVGSLAVLATILSPGPLSTEALLQRQQPLPRTSVTCRCPPCRWPASSSSRLSNKGALTLDVHNTGWSLSKSPLQARRRSNLQQRHPPDRPTVAMSSTAALPVDDRFESPEPQQAAAASTGSVNGDPDTSVGGGTATITDEIFNLIKSIVGAGVLALPAGIAAFGSAPGAVVPAVALIAAIGTLSAYGFGLIGRVCGMTGTGSFRDAWSATVSQKTSWIPACSVTLKTCFACLAYSMILADTFHALLSAAGFPLTKTATLCGLTTTVLLPLCLLKNLSSLAPFSLLGSLGMVYTAVAMGIRYLGGGYRLPAGRFVADLAPAYRPTFGSSGAGAVMSPATSILIGMLSTAYMAHFNAPKFYTELKNNTVPRYLRVVTASFAASIAMYACIGAVGYLTFGAASSGVILNNYSVRDRVMGLSRIAVACSLLFSYPLAFVGARDGMLDLFKVKKRPNKLLNTFAVGFLSFMTVAALIIPDVSFVLAFAGATLGNALIYIFPALMFRGAVKRQAKPATAGQKAEVKIALASAATGLAMGVMGAFKAVQSIL